MAMARFSIPRSAITLNTLSAFVGDNLVLKYRFCLLISSFFLLLKVIYKNQWGIQPLFTTQFSCKYLQTQLYIRNLFPLTNTYIQIMVPNDLKTAFDDQGTPRAIEQFDPNTIPVEPVAPDPVTQTTDTVITDPAAVIPPAEPVTEPEIKVDAEGKPIVAEPAVPPVKVEPSFFDKLKGNQDKPAEPVQAQLPDDVKQKLEEYERITSSDLFKLLNGEKDLTKIDLKDLGKKLAGEDFSVLDNTELLKRALKNEYPNISDADLQKATDSRVTKFEAMYDWEQNLQRSQMIDTLSKTHKPEEIFSTLQAIQKNQSTDPAADQKKAIDTYRQQLLVQYEELGKQMVGQEYMGYKQTEEDRKGTLAEFIDNVDNFTPEKNFFRMMKAATYERYGDAKYKEGYEKAMIEKGRPDFGKSNAAVIQPKTQEGMKNMSLKDFYEMQPS